jgi:integrase
MATFKGGKTWWADFSVNGHRFRQSLGTRDWREALAREKELIAQAREGKLSVASESFARLPFPEALDTHLQERAAQLSAMSLRSQTTHAKPLREHFAAVPVARITTESVLTYIRARKENRISNVTVNMEIGILRRVLKRARRWSLVSDTVPHLPERRDVGRALTPDQKARLLRLAAARLEWDNVRLAATLALNTTMRACELRGLQWRDVGFIERILAIRRSKTEAGERVIPLNADAWAGILELRERIKLFYGTEPQPDWYVFPSGEGQGPKMGAATVRPDPTRPMNTWRTAWRSLTRAIECLQCGQLQALGEMCANEDCKADIHRLRSPLHGLRFHDLRHHAITGLAESLASDQTIMSIAGHVSPKMLAHYSHVRLEAKRQAPDALARGALRGSYGTNDVTISQPKRVQLLQPVEKYGGDDETRTRELCRGILRIECSGRSLCQSQKS